MKPPLSLSMLKMEKNFIAVIEKNYQRKPYEEWPIMDPNNPAMSLIGFVTREKEELDLALDILRKHTANFNRVPILHRQDIYDQIIKAMWEVADVSNTLDYLFEGLLKLLKTWEGDL